MLFRWIFTCAVLLIPPTAAETCPPPFQEGTHYVLSHTVDTQTQNPPNLTLQFKSRGRDDDDFLILWTCPLQLATHNCYPALLIFSLTPFTPMSANITYYGNGTYKAYSTISTMPILFDGFTFRWSFGNTFFEPCDVEVYDFNSTPSCDQPYLEYNGNVVSPDNIQVTVNCNISHVYPEPKCQFTRNGQVTEHDATRSTGTTKYYDRQCTITTPVANLVPKLYEFQMLMYPVVTNGQDFGKTATTPAIDLSLPKPTCEDPRMTNNNNDVIVTCTISSVFTGFTCNFNRKTDSDGDFQPIGTQNQITLSSCSNSPSVSCDSQCTLTASVSELGVGIHRFKVSTRKGVYTTDSDSTGSINLRYPTPEIVNCPNGENDYIKQGDTETCVCQASDQGYPPGRAQWVLSDNTEVGDRISDLRSSLSVTYDPKDQSPKLYYCQVETFFPPDNNPKESFSPKFAFGPEEVEATLKSPAVIKLCRSPAPREPIHMDCGVPARGVNPKPTVVVESQGNVIQPFYTPTPYQFYFVFIPSNGGNLTPTCVATNPMIPSMKVEDSITVTVLEPPSSPPSMTVDSLSNIPNGQKVDVIDGQPVQVQCQVQGGFPPVTKVYMLCAGLWYGTNGTKSTQSLTLKKSNHDDTCSCFAVHSSGCYSLSTTSTFNVQFASRVTNYTVQTPTQQVVVQDGTNMDNSDSSRQLEVEVGTLVTFVCEGEGNPRPEVTVKSQRSISAIPSQLTPSGSYNHKAVATKTMACRDTAFYECEAFNGIGVASNETLLVTVLCTPELPEEDAEPPTFTFKNDTDVKIEIRILGRPPPTVFKLTKIVTRTKRSTDSEEIQSDRYNATFKAIDELNGQVTLVIYGMTDRDIGQYQLDIQNGIGDGLTHSFSVDIEKDDSDIDGSNNIAVIVGGIVAFLVLATVVAFVIVFLRRKGMCKKSQDGLYENNKPAFGELAQAGMPPTQEVSPQGNSTRVQSSEYANIDCPPNRGHYEEVDNDFLPPQPSNENAGGCDPSSREYVYPDDYQNSQPKTVYKNVPLNNGLEDSGYVNERCLNETESSAEPDHVYNSLEDNDYNTPGAPYEGITRGTEISTSKGAAYVNVGI